MIGNKERLDPVSIRNSIKFVLVVSLRQECFGVLIKSTLTKNGRYILLSPLTSTAKSEGVTSFLVVDFG